MVGASTPVSSVPCVTLRSIDFSRTVKSLEGCHGPHYSVREIFVKARQMAPCLLVFEDLDSLITDNVKSFFLNEVDGLESNDGIMMIGSTNYRKSSFPELDDVVGRHGFSAVDHMSLFY